MKPLVLASASVVRAGLLRAAGIDFEVEPADIDETSLKESFISQGLSPRAIAEALAEQKALAIAARKSDTAVIGADQVLSLDGELLSKPPNLTTARAQLASLRGRKHVLITAACLAAGGAVHWRYTAETDLWVRPFSDEFLDAYLAGEGDAILGSVGCYRLEGRGAQLFERIVGDYFSVLGLPLVPLLTALRDQGLLRA
jgi:septum formation protein